MKNLLLIAALTFPTLSFSQTWKITDYNGYAQNKAVTIKSVSGEESLTLYRFYDPYLKKGFYDYPLETVFIELGVPEEYSVINGTNIKFKATKGGDVELKVVPRITGFTTEAITEAFNGKSDETCGIVGNIIHSDTLILQYFTDYTVTRDVKFELPKNSGPLFKMLGFNKSKDCTKIIE